jgi:hypothetical protein
MKNPFEKKDNSTLIFAIAAGALTAGVLTYLYLTESGASARTSLAHKVKDEAKNLAAALISDKTDIHKHTVKKVADHVVK